MPAAMDEIPELRGVRGGLQQTLTNLIDAARNRVLAKMGTEREKAVARSLQRGRRRRMQPFVFGGRFNTTFRIVDSVLADVASVEERRRQAFPRRAWEREKPTKFTISL
jgi:hypothetical protein